MKNLKVAIKLIISYAIIFVLTITVGLIGILGMNSIKNADSALYTENVLAIGAMGDIRENLQNQRVVMRNYVIHSTDTAAIQSIQNDMTALEREMEAFFAEYEATITDTAAESAYFEAKRVYQTDYASIKEDTRQASLIGLNEATEVLGATRNTTVIGTMMEGFTQAMEFNDELAQGKALSNVALFQKMLLMEVIVLIVVMLLTVFFAIYISRLISSPLSMISAFLKHAGTTGNLVISQEDEENFRSINSQKDEIGELSNSTFAFLGRVTEISNKLELVANGDLTVDVKLLSDSDTMGRSMKQLVGSFNDMFGSIHTTTNQVSTGAKQVADGAQSLAEGSTEQAASIEQLSSSIAEIASRTKDNAEIADRTSKLSETIKENAERGSHQMDDMIAAVKDINDASQSISKIIKTIDDIAFQTNILALNAAVEAARAGQHGKGFAVVAEEVRNLASKSAEAAKDTGDMIQNSIEKAELGSHIAGETATSLKEIVSGINESSQLAAEIARASEEQSVGIEQINAGIDQVAQVVQQNSATAEQSAATSEEMSSHATILEQMIQQFKLR
ncbi:MAG: methyl-accepting chemotaxis protein [Peptococcaceae bacterium]|nr:methyl-accepting chemotaxis protein [Peptococcaceae bacterium]